MADQLVPPMIHYWFERPKAWTFQMAKLRSWVEARIQGRCLNLFGGFVRLAGDTVHNDIRSDLLQPGDLNRNAYLASEWADLSQQFDTVILDPPYSAYQAVHTYGVKKQQDISHARDVAEFVLKPGGRVISLGFNSTGMGKTRGFTKTEIALVNCGASHNDYITVVERRL